MSMHATAAVGSVDDRTYRRRIRAWTFYDWANSAFATTILAAVLPVYYGQVAGATLPSEAAATGVWSLGLSVSLFVIAVLSPVLGTVSDIMRGKKRFLAVFVGLGVVATGLLVLVSTGDWMLASALFIVGRIGFAGANVFYDALLPHVARPADRDRVSTRGYAFGYLGGGLLLAANAVMINVIPDWFDYAGIRLSLLSVAVWWAVFSIPVLTVVPEPPAAAQRMAGGVLRQTFGQLRGTLRDVRRYRELFKYLVAFLIYNDGIGTIIGVAGIYGAELGLSATDLILALLLVQFAGIPFALIFGRLPDATERRRPLYLAFIAANLVLVPLVGVVGRGALPASITGAPPAALPDAADAINVGEASAEHPLVELEGMWAPVVIPADALSGGAFIEAINTLFGEPTADTTYVVSDVEGAAITIPFNGRGVRVMHSTGPDHGVWAVTMDGDPLVDASGAPVAVDARSESPRYGVASTFEIDEPGRHTLTLTNSGPGPIAVAGVRVLPPPRHSNLLIILGIILAIQAVGAVFALLAGEGVFSGLAATLDTKRSLLLSLLVYCAIAVWGYFVNSTLEFWLLAWMVATVQGGSQALSRSLYSSMSPAAKSGEFFGLFSVMAKFSAILGPILFAAAAATFGSSRPAVLSVIIFFVAGMLLLARVDVDAGRRIAEAEDAALLGAAD